MTNVSFTIGDQVRYVPSHAHGDPTHPDCENGVVTSVNPDNRTALVRYIRNNILQSTAARTSWDQLIPWS